jgi:hypothetical protein
VVFPIVGKFHVSLSGELSADPPLSLGDRPREIGVHITPTDYTPEQLEQVVAKCKGLWNEKTLSRLAVPEMLE